MELLYTPLYPTQVPFNTTLRDSAFNFVDEQDEPLPIGHHQTISAPHMHATALSVLSDHIRKPGSKVLDVGSGTASFLSV